MTTNKATALYLALATALALGTAQVQAQADDPDYVADPEVYVEATVDEHTAVIEEHVIDVAAEEATREEDLALEQQAQEEAHDEEMSDEVALHKAEMEAHLRSQGLPAPN